jgi:hypothetical protein
MSAKDCVLIAVTTSDLRAVAGSSSPKGLDAATMVLSIILTMSEVGILPCIVKEPLRHVLKMPAHCSLNRVADRRVASSARLEIRYISVTCARTSRKVWKAWMNSPCVLICTAF